MPLKITPIPTDLLEDICWCRGKVIVGAHFQSTKVPRLHYARIQCMGGSHYESSIWSFSYWWYLYHWCSTSDGPPSDFSLFTWQCSPSSKHICNTCSRLLLFANSIGECHGIGNAYCTRGRLFLGWLFLGTRFALRSHNTRQWAKTFCPSGLPFTAGHGLYTVPTLELTKVAWISSAEQIVDVGCSVRHHKWSLCIVDTRSHRGLPSSLNEAVLWSYPMNEKSGLDRRSRKRPMEATPQTCEG